MARLDKVVIRLNDKTTLELTVDEARQLFNELGAFFGGSSPWIPYPNVIIYPTWPCPPIITDNTSWDDTPTADS